MAERRDGPSGVKNAKSPPRKAASGDGRRKAASGNGAAKTKTKTKANAPRKPRARRTRARKGGTAATSAARPSAGPSAPSSIRRSSTPRSPSRPCPSARRSCSATCSRSSRSTRARPRSRWTATPSSQAFAFACEHHADQRRKSGEDFINHPVGVAKVCAGLRLDTETLCAALLHDTVEDTSASLEEVQERFGDEIANLVDGVTKLTGITFQSRDEAQAENYRKMMVAMASDIRVILIKLADRLHNMRTIDALPKQKQIEKAKETLDIYGPIAHRLGIHAIKWELEDLAFSTLHPRKYQEIKSLVAQQREEREVYVDKAGDVPAQGARGPRHRGRDRRSGQALLLDLLEDDQEGPRVQRDLRPHRDAGHRGLGEGLLRRGRRHPLAVEAAPRALQGLHRDAQVQHVPVAAHDGHRARGPAVGDPDPHVGDARHGRVRHRRALDLQDPEGGAKGDGRGPDADGKLKWLRRLLDWQQELEDSSEFVETLKVDLFEDEVFVFTPKGEVKSLAAGATPLDFAYDIHTDVGHRCVGAKVNNKIVPLHYELQSGDIVEVLTSKRERGPSRDWLALVKTTRARNKIKQWFRAESRKDTEHAGRELLQEHMRKQGLPAAAAGRRADPRPCDPRDGLQEGRRLLHRARAARRCRPRSSRRR